MRRALVYSEKFIRPSQTGEVGTRDAFRYMGLVAVAGGFSYKVIHIIWLKKFDAVRFF